MTLRLGLILAALGACIVFVWFALYWREEAIRNALRADAAERQSSLNATTGAIGDRVSSERVIILKQTEERADEVATMPSPDVPADILSGWHSGLRYSTGRTDAERSSELPATLPATEPG